jgi:hypothetical protein
MNTHNNIGEPNPSQAFVVMHVCCLHLRIRVSCFQVPFFCCLHVLFPCCFPVLLVALLKAGPITSKSGMADMLLCHYVIFLTTFYDIILQG